MENFFKYYTEIESLQNPIRTFSFGHVLMLLLTIVCIWILYKKYSLLDEKKAQKFMKGFAIYYVLEESIYYLWLIMHCDQNLGLQLVPLELCTLCVYMNVLSVVTKWKTARFFSMVTGMIAGSIAMIYPANITDIYPLFSYRTINFYMLHGSFILFALIQLKDQSLLRYYYLKRSYFIVCGMFSVAFIVNVMLDTQYMFVGIPPEIGIIASVYQITGVMFFLPVVYLVLFIFQWAMFLLLRKASKKHDMKLESL